MAENKRKQRPFHIGGGYKLAIVINALLCLVGIAVLVFAGVYSAQHVIDDGAFTSVIVCGVALTLIGIASAVTGLYHFNITDTEHNKGSGSMALGVIASIILFVIGAGLLVFSCVTRSSMSYVADNFAWFIVCGCLFTLLGIMSFGVSGWFKGHRKRALEKEDGTE